jgi:hypothetical protein
MVKRLILISTSTERRRQILIKQRRKFRPPRSCLLLDIGLQKIEQLRCVAFENTCRMQASVIGARQS